MKQLFQSARLTLERIRESLGLMQSINRDFMSPVTRRRLNQIRVTIAFSTLILMTTPAIFGEMIDRTIGSDYSNAFWLLAAIVVLIVVRTRIERATHIRNEQQHGGFNH
jgi:hypothetical protein